MQFNEIVFADTEIRVANQNVKIAPSETQLRFVTDGGQGDCTPYDTLNSSSLLQTCINMPVAVFNSESPI